MSDLKHIHGLEIGEDIGFQEKEWRFERAGWIAMAIVILLALAGLFGGGPVSTVTKPGQGGFQITYERFDRQMNPSQISIDLPVQTDSMGEVVFWIDRGYLETVQIENISPSPDLVQVSPDKIFYTLQVASSTEPVTVVIDFRHTKSGLVEGQVGWNENLLSFNQFVFP